MRDDVRRVIEAARTTRQRRGRHWFTPDLVELRDAVDALDVLPKTVNCRCTTIPPVEFRRRVLGEFPRWDPEDVGPLDADDIIRKAGDLAYVVTDPYRSRRANFRFVMHPETLDVLRGGPVWRYAIPSDGPLHEQTYSVGHAVDPVARRVFGLPVRVDVETRPGVVVLETYTERDTNNHHPEAR